MPSLPKQPKPTNRPTLRRAWADERNAARQARAADDHAAEWHRLERAHVISQPLPAAHVRTHLAMLAYGLRHHDRREVVGQLVRTVVAAPASLAGRYPLGNTGGANVRAVTPMPIPADLQGVLDHARAGSAPDRPNRVGRAGCETDPAVAGSRTPSSTPSTLPPSPTATATASATSEA